MVDVSGNVDVNVPDVNINLFGESGAGSLVGGFLEGIMGFFANLTSRLVDEAKDLNSLAWIIATVMTIATLIIGYRGLTRK